MATNLQNDTIMNRYGVVGEMEVGLKFYPRNTPQALISPNDITVTPIGVECTTADAGPAGLPFLLRFASSESRKVTVESLGIDNAAVPRKMLMW